MSRPDIAEVLLPDGETLRIEISLGPEAGDDIAWRPGQRLKIGWEELKDEISKISKWVSASVRDGLPDSPTRVGVEFGLKVTAETGELIGVLAKAGGEATIVVRLEWDGIRAKS